MLAFVIIFGGIVIIVAIIKTFFDYVDAPKTNVTVVIDNDDDDEEPDYPKFHDIDNPKVISPTSEEPPKDNAIVLAGGIKRNIYIYDDRPLSSMPVDRAFYLDVVSSDVTMTSITTKYTTNSRAEGDVPLRYHGRLVGFIRMQMKRDLFDAAKSKDIQIKAVWPGGMISGVKRVVGLLPSNKAILTKIGKTPASK